MGDRGLGVSQTGRIFWAALAGGIFACLLGIAGMMLLGLRATGRGFDADLKRYAFTVGPLYMILFLPVFGVRFFWRPAALQWVVIPASAVCLAALAICDGYVSRIVALTGVILFCLIVLVRLFVPLRLPTKPTI